MTGAGEVDTADESAATGDQRIGTGDSVYYERTDEELLVAFAEPGECGQDGRLAWIGWPLGWAPLSEFRLVKKATPLARIAVLRRMASSPFHVQARAREILLSEGVDPTEPGSEPSDTQEERLNQ